MGLRPFVSRLSMIASIAALVLAPLVDVSRSQDKFEELAPEGGCTPIVEGFASVPGLTAAGWSMQNLSNPGPGATANWFQGNINNFPAQAGATNSYASAIFTNGTGVSTLSVWLITPQMPLANGQQMTFFTRTATPGATVFPDRMQVRMSTAGASTTVGPGATGVGDFTNLLLDINPNYSTTEYPSIWTQFTVTVTGLSAPTSGRFAFRYFVENSGPDGTQGDAIGVDTVNIGCPVNQTSASVSGRVVDPSGRGIANTLVTMTGGASPQLTRTSAFGYFTFVNVPFNVQYTITPASKRHTFASQQVTPTADVTGLVFTGTPNP